MNPVLGKEGWFLEELYIILRFVDLHPGMIHVINQFGVQFFLYVTSIL